MFIYVILVFVIFIFLLDFVDKSLKSRNDLQNSKNEQPSSAKPKDKQVNVHSWIDSLPIHKMTPEMLVNLSLDSNNNVTVSRDILCNLLAKAAALDAVRSSFSVKPPKTYKSDENAPFYTTKYGRLVKRVRYS
jgi:hypothetical protein